MKRNIELHIEKLVLSGFAPGDRYRIGAAVERELTRLFTERGLPPALARGSAAARIEGGAFDVVSGSRPDQIGVQVAQAVYRGFGQ